MSLFELCIRRPVLSTVLSLLVLVIGAISYTRLAVREYPRIDEPIVSVNTTYPGASADVVSKRDELPMCIQIGRPTSLATAKIGSQCSV